MLEIRFAQLSDLHLGVRFTGGKLAMPRDCAEQRERELRAALALFVDTAVRERVNLALLPGDLFHTPEPLPQDINFVIEQLNRLHPIPTFITPGNHDPYSRTSVYSTESALYGERPSSAPRWREHVHIFTDREFTSVGLGEVCITGCAFQEETPPGAPPLSALLPSREAVLNILMFHGSLRGYLESDEPEVLPFTEAELAACGHDYAALGHYHAPRLIQDDQGRVTGAYAGAPLACSVSHTGERGFIIGTLRTSGGAQHRPSRSADAEDIRWITSDPRKIRHVSVDVTGITNPSALEAQVRQGLRDVRREDIVYLRLTGRFPPGMPPRVPSSLFDDYFHVRPEDESTPDYDLPFGRGQAPDTGARDVQSLFIQRLLQRWDGASSEQERERIAEAAAYGLDALTQGRVSLR
jgi:DNA repair exonuclease SbcCD nuclease subunit